MTSVEDRASKPVAGNGSTARFAVAWQHPIERSIYPIGLLDITTYGYRFRYLRRAADVQGFLPLIGFPDLSRDYRSPRLFPFFEQRVMDRRRPDFKEYAAALGVAEDATEIELLARSSGNRIGDSIRLSLEPRVDYGGEVNHVFPVHGVRYSPSDQSAVSDVLDRLIPGERLELRGQPDNDVNRRALLVTTADGEVALGWVPDLLLEFVHLVLSTGEARLSVLRVNPSDLPAHLRLFVRLQGRGPAGHRGFSTVGWETFSDD